MVLLKPFSNIDSTKLGCTVTVPKNIHMQTCGAWMEAWLEHAECQLQAVDQVFFCSVWLLNLLNEVLRQKLLSRHCTWQLSAMKQDPATQK